MTSRRDPDCCTPSVDPRIARQFDARYDGWTEEEGFPELVDVSGAILDLVRDAAMRRPSVLDVCASTRAWSDARVRSRQHASTLTTVSSSSLRSRC